MLESLQKQISQELLLSANFGLEREGLRVSNDGFLSMQPHPKAFGSKEENLYITTDFSESQLEFITPTFSSELEASEFLDSLYNIAALELKDEYIWPQSMPAVVDEDITIPIAVFEHQHNKEKQMYREYLLEKYGGKKQLISGIHVNVSFNETLLHALYKNHEQEDSYLQFKNDLYLKTTRNFLRYNWLFVYLLGATNIIHQSFEETCVKSLDKINEDTYSHKNAISFRNTSCGYQNIERIMPNYESVEKYIHSIKDSITAKKIKDIRELYAPIRLKNKGEYGLNNLEQSGIEYIEIRSIDCNPFVKSGIATDDLRFIHYFLLYCALKEESKFKDWQEAAYYNSDITANEGLNNEISLIRDGFTISLKEWGSEILEEMVRMFLPISKEAVKIIQAKKEVINDTKKTYAYQIASLCEKENYIAVHLKLAKRHKQSAYEERYRLKPYTDLELSTQILLMESIKKGIAYDILDRTENFISLQKDNNIQYIKQATKTSKDTYVSVLVMENKVVTKKVLEKQDINVPSGDEFHNIESAVLSLPNWIGKPVVIKPKSTNFGLGISIFSEGTVAGSLRDAFEIAFREDNTVLIESFVKGDEYRFLVIGDETVAVLHRIPANVEGDGNSTITELIAEKNKNPLRGKGYKTPLEKIRIDDNMKLFLQQFNLTPDSIIEAGKVQYLRENSNISTGGDSIDVTEEIPEYYKQIAVKSAKTVGANICGVDMIIRDITSSEYSYSIIELNFNPAIHIHSFPFKGKERNIAEKILHLLEL